MAKATILLVEDDSLQAEQTKSCLEKSGYDVLLADTGRAALKAAKTGNVELILLDRILPDMDGSEVCRWLRLSKDTKIIPIIMLTVKGSVMERVDGLEAGADDYLPKPYSEIELNARIYACLRTKSLRDELKGKNSQLEELLSRMEILSITDSLTDLFNRRHFMTILRKEFERTLRYKFPVSCLMIDVDHFKAVNDQYGHNMGDMVLKEIAHLIKDSLRKADTAARWGGEEFVILLPGTHKQDSFVAASRILRTVSEHDFPGIPEQITISIGMANIPHLRIDSAERLIDASEIALSEAKRKGRNRIEIAARDPE
ncbi:MAG TPA: diguanylate cyclase [Thermodesulfovibrionales bacterium]|nr:diguanylate cyclase [Thermodesulfovibrionales bacterium]